MPVLLSLGKNLQLATFSSHVWSFLSFRPLCYYWNHNACPKNTTDTEMVTEKTSEPSADLRPSPTVALDKSVHKEEVDLSN